MNRTVPWSIKGVGYETREAAKEAARMSGQSLGDWLDAIIAERASALGATKADMGSSDKMEAVAAELNRMTGTAASPRVAQHLTEESLVEQNGEADPAGEADASREPAVRPVQASAPGARDQMLADQANAAAERVFGQNEGSTEAPAERADHGAGRVSPPRATGLRSIADRMKRFAAQDESQPDVPAPAEEEIVGIEGRRRTDSETAFAPGKAKKDRSIREAVAEIARRQAILDAEEEVVQRNGTTGEVMPEFGTRTAPAAPAPRDPLPPAAEPRQSGATLDHLDDVVSALEARLEGARRNGGAGSANRAGGSEIRRDVMPVRTSTADPVQDGTETVAAFDALGRELRQAISAIDAPPAAERIDRQLRDGGRKLEGITAAVPPGTMLSPAGDPNREVRDMLAMWPSRSAGDIVERQMSNIDRRLSQIATVPHAEGSATEVTLGEMRALLDRFRPGSAIESLERRMDDLAVKIDQGSAPSSQMLEGLARQIEEMHESLKSRVVAPGADTRSMEALVRSIADRIEETRGASAGIGRLESLMSHLAAKIEDGTAQTDAKAVNGLESQISKLAERLERSESSLSSLDAVEHSLGELFSQLEETRHAAIDAAENAARTAARDTLRAAMQNPPLAARPEKESEFVEQVTHELSELRVMQDASDRRTQATLTGLHQSMEKLVEHLGSLGAEGRQGSTEPLYSDEPGTRQAGGASAERDAPIVRAEPALQVRRRRSDGDRAPPSEVDPVDALIEPGSGRGPARDAAAKAAPSAGKPAAAGPANVTLPAAESQGPASYIAAARRAAQAAQASAASVQKPAARIKMPAEATSSSALSTLQRARGFLIQKRRPILLSLAGLILLLGALQVVRLGFSDSDAPVRAGAQEATSPKLADSGARPVPLGGASTAPSSAAVAADASSAPPRDAAATTGDVGATKGGAPRTTNPFLSGVDLGVSALPEGLRTLAQSGDAGAQYEVGLRLADGRGVTRDVKAAAVWFEKAAAQGFAPAQYRLGSAFEKGIGEAKDPALALAWYGRAAEAGNMRAMHNLAVMAAEGAVGKPDYAKAATWFQKAAALGIRDSQFNLAILYARGLGIEQSLSQSYTWFAIAANQGDDDSAKKRDEVAARLDAKTLAAAKAAADAFQPATAVSAANEAAPPPGGWDALAPAARPAPAAKTSAPKVSVL